MSANLHNSIVWLHWHCCFPAGSIVSDSAQTHRGLSTLPCPASVSVEHNLLRLTVTGGWWAG
eukprot:13672715-Alexandrium_andersonii.AAC.1